MSELESRIARTYDPAKTKRLGMRGLFRIAIILSVLGAFIILVSISYANVSTDERVRAEASIRSEVNYLCLQLESLGNRAAAFDQITGAVGASQQELESADPENYRLLSDPVGDILAGYTLAETGTVAIISDNTVIATDDERVPVGSDARKLLGSEVYAAIEASLQSDEVQSIPYGGVFDEAGGEGAYGDKDDEAFLLARQQGDYTVMIIEPTSMVFRDRNAIIGREIIISLIILAILGTAVDRLLSLIIARRIDRTNEVLRRITSGDLEARVEEGGTREFVSLASDINATVEALQSWIAEAEARMASELTAAQAIQESALPSTFPAYPDIPKFDIYAIMNAAREVGGDFYDFFLLGDSGPDSGKLAFLIADVSGKGVPAALFMMKAKTQVRRELQSGTELSQAIEIANTELAEGNDACMFVTMWVGVLDYATGHVDYVNAGHNPALFWQKKTGWRWLSDKSGMPLGLYAGLPYKALSLDCEAGDKILLYTDGVTEAMSKQADMYGEERLEAIANGHSAEHPEELVQTVRHDVAIFAQDAEQSDDITILVLEMNENPA